MSTIVDWGLPVVQWMQSLGLWLEPVMQFFTFLGTEDFYLLIMPIFIWWVDIDLGIRLGLGLLISANINFILKVIFGLPRPYWVSTDIMAFGSDPYFGLPSGHAQNAVVIWGMLASWSKKHWLRAAMLFLILMISLSRIYLGVHFPLDTIAGLILGGLLLWLFLRFGKTTRSFIQRLTVSEQVALSVLTTALFLVVGLLSIHAVRGRTIPAEWGAQAAQASADPINPLAPEALIANVATFFGISTGAIMLMDWGGFKPEGTWGQRVGRYVLGVVGLVLLYFGLRLITPSEPVVLGAVLRFIRYALVGFWVAYLAPRLFSRLRLA